MKYLRHLSPLRLHTLLMLIVALMATAFAASAQQEQNNIYLFDCTGSMIKQGLWQPAKDALNTTITTQTGIPGSDFTVIPFGDEPYPSFTFSSGEYAGKRKDIDAAFEKGVKQARYTNICAPLEQAFGLCDPARENKIYLLTDGEPNRGGGPAEVAALIDRWCASHRNTRLFYVALSASAVNPVIEAAINRCSDAYIVKCSGSLIPQIADIAPSEIHANIEELGQEHILRFSIPGSFPVEITCDDEYFTAEIVGGKAADRHLAVRLRPRGGQKAGELHSLLAPLVDASHIYRFPVRITAGDSGFFIANPVVEVNMADRIQSKLSLLGGDTDEYLAGEARWYDSFLWSPASPDGEITVDLAPRFANAGADASLSLMAVPANGQPADFRVFFNGAEVPAGQTFEVKPGSPALLRIIFANGALEGKRYITLLLRGSEGIDIVNGQPAADLEGVSIRGKYSVNWNPLKTWLTIAAIVLVGLLLLWLLVLKFIFFPTIKVGRIEIVGPGSYYSTKKIKGARKVILTSRRRSQNILSRIFTGEVRFVRADHFTPEIEILPASRKKIRLRSLAGRSADGWDFSPASILSPYDKASVLPRQGATGASGSFAIEAQ